MDNVSSSKPFSELIDHRALHKILFALSWSPTLSSFFLHVKTNQTSLSPAYDLNLSTIKVILNLLARPKIKIMLHVFTSHLAKVPEPIWMRKLRSSNLSELQFQGGEIEREQMMVMELGEEVGILVVIATS